ncbi:MAG: GatB/YqeY domain-containing protein [Chloroflexota bacterium]
MSTKTKLENALKDALRSGDDVRKRTLRMALAAIKNAEIDERGSLDEPGILGILQKEVKTRREAIEGAQQADRPDIIAENEAEIAVLETFLPQPLTLEELEALAKEAIAEAGATSMKDMGKVMQILMPRVRGRAEGQQTSQMVQKLLGSR